MKARLTLSLAMGSSREGNKKDTRRSYWTFHEQFCEAGDGLTRLLRLQLEKPAPSKKNRLTSSVALGNRRKGSGTASWRTLLGFPWTVLRCW